MQHDHVLKKLNFDLLTLPSQSVARGYLLPCCCIRDSLKLDMQHDHILKKLNFDLLTPLAGSGSGGLWAKYLPLCCCICDYI